jgi:cytochrome P450
MRAAAAKCPMDFDPKAPDFMNDPFDFYACLRADAPVFSDPRSGITYVASYELAEHVFRNHALFSSAIDRPAMRDGGMFPALAEVKAQDWPNALTITQNDDVPSHDMFRAMVSQFFLPKNLTAIEPFIRARTVQLLDEVAAKGTAEFVTDFAVPLPISVIGRYLGLDEHGYAKLKQWSDAFADELGLIASDERALEAAHLALECNRAILSTAEKRRANPDADIISHLVAVRLPEGRPLSDPELLSIVRQMLVAGNETTTNTLTAGVLRMARDSALIDRLRAEPERISSFVEETLRLETPVQGQFRRAAADTELAGVPIAKGTLLHVRLASANRDETVFGEDSDRLKLGERPARPHLAFGLGLHFCVGAMLSRLELKIAFLAIANRFGTIALAEAASKLSYRKHFYHRGINRLSLTLGGTTFSPQPKPVAS